MNSDEVKRRVDQMRVLGPKAMGKAFVHLSPVIELMARVGSQDPRAILADWAATHPSETVDILLTLTMLFCVEAFDEDEAEQNTEMPHRGKEDAKREDAGPTTSPDVGTAGT